MITYIRANSSDPNFQKLFRDLDQNLSRRDGEVHCFYAQFNKTDNIRNIFSI
jgi:putative acetyltransferase